MFKQLLAPYLHSRVIGNLTLPYSFFMTQVNMSKSFSGNSWMFKMERNTNLPSLISIVIDRDTTSLEARSLAVGAYLSMNLSP